MTRCFKKFTIYLAFFMLAWAPLSKSTETPKPNLKGVFIGQSLKSFDDAHGGCTEMRGRNTNMCYIPTTEFGVGIYARITAFFVDGKCVDAIVSEIHPEDFNQIISGLNSKFRKHGRSHKFVVSNSLGAKFLNQEVVWRFGKIKVKAIKYSGDITESTVELYSSGMKEYERRMKGSASENAAKM